MTLRIPDGMTPAEAQKVLDAAAPKEKTPGQRLYELVGPWAVTSWARLSVMGRDFHEQAASKFLSDYVKRSKVEAVLATRHTIRVPVAGTYPDGFDAGHAALAVEIRKALEGE